MRILPHVRLTIWVFVAFVLCFPVIVVVEHNLALEQRGEISANMTPQQIGVALQNGEPYNQQMYLSDLAQLYRETPGYRDCPVNDQLLANPSLSESDLLKVEPCANSAIVARIAQCKLSSTVDVGIEGVWWSDNVDFAKTFHKAPADGVSMMVSKPFSENNQSAPWPTICSVSLRTSPKLQLAAMYLLRGGKPTLLRSLEDQFIMTDEPVTLVLLWNNPQAPPHDKGILGILPFGWRELAQELVAEKKKYPR